MFAGRQKVASCAPAFGGQGIGHVTPAHITLAAVVEMIQTATLIHDDVLDEAKLRRHLKTCNARWDNEASILLGDYLFTQAFYLTSTLNSTYACRRIGQTTNTVCAGELRQVRSSGNFKITEAEYFSIIEAKTSSLVPVPVNSGLILLKPLP